MKGGLIAEEPITCFHTSTSVGADSALLLRRAVNTCVTGTETAVTDVFRAVASG